MKQGEIKFYNDAKEFGFIRDTADDKEYFFHKSVVEGELPRDGDKVEFEGDMGDRGLRATSVKKVAAEA